MGNTHNIYCSETQSKISTEDDTLICERESPLKQIFTLTITLSKTSAPSEISSFTKNILNNGTIGYKMSNKSSFFETSHIQWSSAKEDIIKSLISFMKSENNNIDEEKERLSLSHDINRNGYVERFLKSGKSMHGGILICDKFTISIDLDEGNSGSLSLNSLGPYQMKDSIPVIEKLFSSDGGWADLSKYIQRKNVSTITEIFPPDLITTKIIEASSLSILDPVHSDYLRITFRHST